MSSCLIIVLNRNLLLKRRKNINKINQIREHGGPRCYRSHFFFFSPLISRHCGPPFTDRPLLFIIILYYLKLINAKSILYIKVRLRPITTKIRVNPLICVCLYITESHQTQYSWHITATKLKLLKCIYLRGFKRFNIIENDI